QARLGGGARAGAHGCAAKAHDPILAADALVQSRARTAPPSAVPVPSAPAGGALNYHFGGDSTQSATNTFGSPRHLPCRLLEKASRLPSGLNMGNPSKLGS